MSAARFFVLIAGRRTDAIVLRHEGDETIVFTARGERRPANDHWPIEHTFVMVGADHAVEISAAEAQRIVVNAAAALWAGT